MKNFMYILPSDRNQSEKLSSGKYTTVETVKISIIARDLGVGSVNRKNTERF